MVEVQATIDNDGKRKSRRRRYGGGQKQDEMKKGWWFRKSEKMGENGRGKREKWERRRRG